MFVRVKKIGPYDAADGVWRVAYAFDPSRWVILLFAGDKSGQAPLASTGN